MWEFGEVLEITVVIEGDFTRFWLFLHEGNVKTRLKFSFAIVGYNKLKRCVVNIWVNVERIIRCCKDTTMNSTEKSMSVYREEMIEHVIGLFRDTMPFNKLLGLEFIKNKENVELHLSWQEALTGNPMQKILHGGVTATMLDTIGGLVAAIETIKRTNDSELMNLQTRLSTMGTVDMRVDYLRPGRGERFIATATVIRSGARLAVCRMELHNDSGDHLAFGTGTYMLG